MAQRRMFSLDIVDSDAFLEMPTSARLLYYDLGMRADDDGFVSSPKKILKITSATDDDLKILIAKRFILLFDSGIVVIKHWNINNYIQKDRYHKTRYVNEKKLLAVKANGSYTEKNKKNSLNVYRLDTARIQVVDRMDTETRLGKVRLGKDNSSRVDEQRAPNLFKRLPTESQTVTHRLGYLLEDTLKTRIVNWGKQAKAVSNMLRAGYTEAQIGWTIQQMAQDDFFADKGFDLTTVSNQIPRFKAIMERRKNVQEAIDEKQST